MSKSRDISTVRIEGGKHCPRCKRAMQRFKHSEDWRALPGRGWFKWWDICGPCQKICNYGEARMPAAPLSEDDRVRMIEPKVQVPTGDSEAAVPRPPGMSARKARKAKLAERAVKREAKRMRRAAAAAEAATLRPSPVIAASAPSKLKKDEFYRSWEWSTLRMRVLKQYGRTCMCCGAMPGNGVVIHVDHIKPLHTHWHLRLDRNNLQVLCEACNKGKGAWDRTDYRPQAEAPVPLAANANDDPGLAMDLEYRSIINGSEGPL